MTRLFDIFDPAELNNAIADGQGSLLGRVPVPPAGPQAVHGPALERAQAAGAQRSARTSAYPRHGVIATISPTTKTQGNQE